MLLVPAYDPQHGFVITGGQGQGALSGAERTFDGINFSSFPDMPRALLDYHCLVSLKNGNLFATGGVSCTFMYHGSNTHSARGVGKSRSCYTGYRLVRGTWDRKKSAL